MKRAFLCGLLAAASLSLTVHGVRTVPVQVDGAHLDAAAYLEQGVTYVPLRSLLDAMGGWELTWDAPSATAVAVNGSRTLTADPAANTITVDGISYDGAVQVVRGRDLCAPAAGRQQPGRLCCLGPLVQRRRCHLPRCGA